MFYVTSICNNLVTVIDTDDQVKESYMANELENFNVDIEGFINANEFYVVRPYSVVRDLFKDYDYKNALKFMMNEDIELRFRSKGKIRVTNRAIEIHRRGKNSYSFFDENRRYYSGLDFSEICDRISWYFNSNILTGIRKIERR